MQLACHSLTDSDIFLWSLQLLLTIKITSSVTTTKKLETSMSFDIIPT